MTVDAGTVVWLKEGVLWAPSSDTAVTTAFGADALERDIISCLAIASDAATEAARQLAFLKGPLAVEVLSGIKGQRSDLIGRPVIDHLRPARI
jgi:coenzyme F420-reducing hydrogenase beta subunit